MPFRLKLDQKTFLIIDKRGRGKIHEEDRFNSLVLPPFDLYFLINRPWYVFLLICIAVMSDIGLPDFSGQDLGIDLEKGIFVRKGKKGDNDSNDSGNNSMNTNGSG